MTENNIENPRLRSVSVKEPYKIGAFPKDFVHIVAGEISARLAVGITDIEGKVWEQIFAKAIGAEWKPSNVGLDDIIVPSLSAAWGAKTVKNHRPFSVATVRLISGRNSPIYSYQVSDILSHTPAELGSMVIGIWNERVAELYKKYKTLRTVVLIKGENLNQICIFEFPTIRYNPDEYTWEWNKNKNLIGLGNNGDLKFTWQPHGSQFTISESLPENALNIEIDTPMNVSDKILTTIGFNAHHYRVIPRQIPINQQNHGERSVTKGEID